ncbi:APC family permease [Mycolicibacterium baixiangningiae]|uniref:APC family permease n=1 Tax=Mycolicibacterium baixiangningiae TaxID=2761578 RepID=UPI001868AFCC|nr:APC family permease [Mycolicibacterium baixiangningiae]
MTTARDVSAGELPSTGTSEPGPTLAAGRISAWQALFFGLAALSLPGLIGSQGAYLVIGGNSAWLATAVAAAFGVVLAFIVVKFARKHVVSGSLMSYLRLEMGTRAGILGGSALFVGYVGAVTTYLSIALYFGLSSLSKFDIAYPSAGVMVSLAVMIVAGCCFLQRRGVSVSVNIAIILGLLCLPLVAIIVAAAVIQHGVQLGAQFALEGFHVAAFVPAVVIAFGAYCGFEGLTALAKETRDPRTTMPTVVLTLVLTVTVATLASALLTVPIMVNNADQLAAGVSPLGVLANVGGVGYLGDIANVLMAVSSVGSLLAYLNDSSRVVATAAQDGYLPAGLGRIQPQFHTPSVAAIAIGAVSAIMFAAFVLLSSDGLLGATINFLVFVSHSWLVVYTAMAVAGAVTTWRSTGLSFNVVVAAFTAFALVAMLGYSVATGTGTTAVFSWVAIGLIVALFVVGVVRVRRELATTDMPSPSPAA